MVAILHLVRTVVLRTITRMAEDREQYLQSTQSNHVERSKVVIARLFMSCHCLRYD